MTRGTPVLKPGRHRFRVAALAAAALATLPAAGQLPADCALCAAGTALIERFELREAPTPVRERPGWAPPTRIVVADQTIAETLREVAPDADIVGVPGLRSFAAMAEVVAGAEVLIGLCSPEIVERGTRLQWIQLLNAGADSCTRVPTVAERGILVTNLQRIQGPHMAEHAMALLLALARGLDMRVIATRNSRREGPDYVEYVGLADEYRKLAAEADVVINSTPLTDDTLGMFDSEFFAAMKYSAFFINIGRGESVVTADLTAALQAGEIAGAGLDATDPEPLPPGHPLWSMRNVILTPHIATRSDARSERTITLVAENLHRYLNGDPLLSVVDLERGY